MEVFNRSTYATIKSRNKLIDKRMKLNEQIKEQYGYILDDIKQYFKSKYSGKELVFDKPLRLYFSACSQPHHGFVDGIRYNEKTDTIEISEYHREQIKVNGKYHWCHGWVSFKHRCKINDLVDFIDNLQGYIHLRIVDFDNQEGVERYISIRGLNI